MASNVNLATASIQEQGVSLRDPRAELAAQFIADGSRVLDLSEDASLQALLPGGCAYESRQNVRCDGGSVCDIVRGDFPTQAGTNADVIVLLGVLERLADIESFFTHLRFCRRDVILSYHATDLGGDQDFTNHLSFYDLARLFDRYGFRIQCTAPIKEGEVLMRLTATERLAPVAGYSVAVISHNDSGTFGGRIGVEMINSLLPGEAEVHHLTFGALHEAREKYDLVVLGIGAGMFQPLLNEGVLDIVSRGRSAIGIFGTQHREMLPPAALGPLLDRLDTWYARYEDDVLLYGRGRNNVVHLGDWLIDRFPMATSTLDDPLEIVEDIRPEHPLDRAISVIQVHKAVFSSRPHALLCALTAAELAAYSEQAFDPTSAPGTFRSMLIDIFGRSYPERQFFMVDRDAVRRYKAQVHRNVATVAARVDAILRNVAVAAA
jgi:hypothetical protein